MAEEDYQKEQFYGSLFQLIQIHGVVMGNTQVNISFSSIFEDQLNLFRMKFYHLIIVVHQ
jgi:hypothetical protein